MGNQSFWKKERRLPGQSAVEETVDTYWMFKFLHPASATAMLIGAIGGGVVASKLFSGQATIAILLAIGVGAFVGAWLGLLLYWVIRLIRAFVV